MTLKTKKELEVGFTWLWRGLVLAVISGTFAFVVWGGEQVITTFTRMSKDITEIKGSMKNQDTVNKYNEQQYKDLCDRVERLENVRKNLSN